MDALDRNLSSDELSRHGRMPYNIVGWAFFFFFLSQLADLVSAGVAIRESRLRRMSAQGGEFATCLIASFGTTRGWCSVEGTFCKATSG